MSASTLDTSIVADSEIITYVIVAVILVLIVLMASLDSYVDSISIIRKHRTSNSL